MSTSLIDKTTGSDGPDFHDLRQAVGALEDGTIDQEAFRRCIEIVVSGRCQPYAAAAFLEALNRSDISLEQLLETAQIVQATVRPKPRLQPNTIGVGGTGGIGLRRFNTTSAAALVAASLGENVAKFGNFSRTGNGSSDLWAALGLPVDRLTVTVAAATLEECGLAIIHAPTCYPQLSTVRDVRRLVEGRDLFNWIGPLLHPLAEKLVVGAAGVRMAEKLSLAMQRLGRTGLVVTGTLDHQGHRYLDELSVSGLSYMFAVSGQEIVVDYLTPAEIGLRLSPYWEIPGGGVRENARLFREMLNRSVDDRLLDLIALNAAAIANFAGRGDWRRGIEEARAAVRSGKVHETFSRYVLCLEKLLK